MDGTTWLSSSLAVPNTHFALPRNLYFAFSLFDMDGGAHPVMVRPMAVLSVNSGPPRSDST